MSIRYVYPLIALSLWGCGASTDGSDGQPLDSRDSSIAPIQPSMDAMETISVASAGGMALPVLETPNQETDEVVDASIIDAAVDAIDAGMNAVDGSMSDAQFMLMPPMTDAGTSNSQNTGVYPGEDNGRVSNELCPPASRISSGCLDALENEAEARLCDGFDNDCDGTIDEGCSCKAGSVQPCFRGPPGRVNTGACRPGTQRCTTIDGRKSWGGL